MTNPTPADVERLIAETEAALKGVTTLADGNAWPSTVALIIGLRDNSIALIAALRALSEQNAALAAQVAELTRERDYQRELWETCITERDTYSDERDAAEAKLAEVEKELDSAKGVGITAIEVAEAHIATLTAQVEAMRGALVACVASLERADTTEGVCCCGDSMDRHSDPMHCGHAPTDMGEYYAGKALEAARAGLTTENPNG